MNLKKRLFKTSLCILIVIFCAVGLVACGNDKNNRPEQTYTETNNSTAEPGASTSQSEADDATSDREPTAAQTEGGGSTTEPEPTAAQTEGGSSTTEPDVTITYTVTFVAENGTTVVGTDTYTVNDTSITEPQVPSKDGFTGAWESYRLTSGNVTVRPIYTPITYTVTFVAENGTTVVGTDTYTVNDTSITVPQVPSKDGFTGAWEGYRLTLGNITVRPIYTPITYTVTFVAENGTTVVGTDTYTVNDTSITEPQVPSKDGYIGVWESYRLTLGNITVRPIYTVDNLICELSSDGSSYIVTGIRDKTLTKVIIPNLYKGKPITAIDEGAFSGCKNLLSLTIPESVTSIGDDTFSECRNLFEVYNLSALNITAGSSEHGWVGCYAYDIYSSLGEASKLSVDANGFVIHTNGNIKTLASYIGTAANITIPSGVTSIAADAFYDCDNLQSITIPDSVTSIGRNAFHYTDWYNNQPDGVVYAGRVAYAYKGDMSGNVSLTLKAGTLGIADSAFEYCSNLTGISIPSSVVSIGAYAFSGCSGLTVITLPSSLTSIGDNAFEWCDNLKSIVIPRGVTSIGNSVFSSCTSLTSITVDSGNTTYQSSGNCLIETASKILIAGCSNSVIPTGGSVTSIGDNAFAYCEGLTSITIPNGITSIGNNAFLYCGNLTSISIPNSVTSIGESAFNGCSSLTNITIGNGVRSIGAYAFSGCSGLTAITLPSSLTSIGDNAFEWCDNLKSIVIPRGVTSIGNSVFSSCTSLTSITVDSGNTTYQSSGNCLIETASKKLIAGLSNSVIPTGGSVTSIGDNAFAYCEGLTSITIPNGITSIGNNAFLNCSNMTSISIPNSVTSIGESAFFGCSSLTDVIIGNGVRSIGVAAFSWCDKLTNISIGGNVTSIGDRAFSGCTALTNITLPGSVTSIGESAFSWCLELTGITIPDSLTSLGNYALSGCSKLTSITFTGTSAQWNTIAKGSFWDLSTGSYTVICTDISLAK